MNRLSMMGELSASLAHEIKQPIATARNNANDINNGHAESGSRHQPLSARPHIGIRWPKHDFFRLGWRIGRSTPSRPKRIDLKQIACT
jgi:signal transduction histidine kinase